ncbi:MAG: hypothetical protein NUV59_03025 [Patescibacteria group bacterium]|nr:hypothetical protein [Patescibacteria group bacterium]
MPKGSGESMGFYRRGMPNAERRTTYDEPGAFLEVAESMRDDIEGVLRQMPELGVRQDEVDEQRNFLLGKADNEGIGSLENAMERAMREDVVADWDNRGKLIYRLALALAYLEKKGDNAKGDKPSIE